MFKYCYQIAAEEFSFDSLGFIDSKIPNTLTFSLSENTLNVALSNPNISVILTKKSLFETVFGKEKTEVKIILVDEPKQEFIKIGNYLPNEQYENSFIEPSALVANSAAIDRLGVYIGPNVVIHENVVIRAGTYISENCHIGAGTCIGSDSFFCDLEGDLIHLLTHKGGVLIENGVQIGQNCVIDKSIFTGEKTIIGQNSLVGPLTNISHGCHIGAHNFLAAGVNFAGYTVTGEYCVFSPGVVTKNSIQIGSHSRVTLGSTVRFDISPNSYVVNGRALPRKI
jgi:UDP-3-O-[3-hydroxymyristoyl] glucosamine N-acyltransferase